MNRPRRARRSTGPGHAEGDETDCVVSFGLGRREGTETGCVPSHHREQRRRNMPPHPIPNVMAYLLMVLALFVAWILWD